MVPANVGEREMEAATAESTTAPTVSSRRRLGPSSFAVFSDCRPLFFRWMGEFFASCDARGRIPRTCPAPVVLFFFFSTCTILFLSPSALAGDFFLSKDGHAQEGAPTDTAGTKGEAWRRAKKKQKAATRAPRT
ncbi:hypothetical protein pdul_cds_344 [Pandoravirus dulcis]|uniref:Transmembrane protein n=1 Tax=Pandoravirus dulcis TaxID=1349409 RepID=A0A291ATZ3_9VIRU|nr:hypothetical protein pdul_cds_344 [Pandoravirus dulcis]ATE82492.1 hypothetical protein pdul_cds_344 [Pandoravirus dulcis]